MVDEPISLQQSVLNFIRDRGHVSFVELTKKFPNEKGNFTLGLPGYENILLWVNLSEAMAEAVARLLESRTIFAHPASQRTYLIDGGGLKLPEAKSPRHYKKPHWLPVTLDVSKPEGV